MNKILTVGLLSAALSACVSKDDPGASSSDTSSSVQQSSSSVAVSSSSISVSSSSVAFSSSSSSSSQAGVTGDATRGASLMVSNAAGCLGCHGTSYPSHGYVQGAIGLIDADDLGSPSSTYGGAYDASSELGIANYIQNNMFSLTSIPSAACEGGLEQCAADIAAYLMVLGDGIPGEPADDPYACTMKADDLRYGPRSLRVLSQFEYENSLKALFLGDLVNPDPASGLGADQVVRGIPINTDLTINDNALDSYDRVAGELAAWAVANPSVLGFDCADAASCAESFVNDFAYRAFRRPLTSAEELDYTTVIATAASPSVGLEWAIRSVLTSPNFLYKSEIGMTVQEAIDTPIEPPPSTAAFDGTPTEFTDLSVVKYESLSVRDDANSPAPYVWSGNSLMALTVKSNKSSRGNWPILMINTVVSGVETNIATINVDHAGARTYVLELNVPAGGAVRLWHNPNANGNNFYEAEPIVIDSLKIGMPGQPEPPYDATARFEQADANAYVLSPYEYASAISYFLTGSSPDSELLTVAGNGSIYNPTVLEAQVDRLIDSNLGHEQVERFAGLWFGTDNVMTANRMGDDAFTQDVKDSMAAEIRKIFSTVFYSDRDFLDVYRGEFTMLDSTLSQFYGVPGGGPGHMQFVEVDTSALSRGGIFASGGFMATYASSDDSSPIKRSVHFRNEVLCQDVPAPTSLGGDELDRTVKVMDANIKRDTGLHNEAEYYAEVTSPAACDACHKAVINPLFAATDFDRFGRTYDRQGTDIFQVAMTFQVPALDGNGNQLIDDLGNPVTIAEFGTEAVDSTWINQGGFLYGANQIGPVGSAADQDLASGNGIAFKGAKDLIQKAVAANLPGLQACLIDRTARLAMGSAVDERLSLEQDSWSQDRTASLNCVKSDMQSAYESGGNSAREVFKAQALSDALLFRR